MAVWMCKTSWFRPRSVTWTLRPKSARARSRTSSTLILTKSVRVLAYAAAFITCRHDPPSHTHILTVMQTDIICLNPQCWRCASIKSSTCPIPSIPTICVSIHPSDQSNAEMWRKWDKFHRNISPGGGWNSTAWCRDYINVRAYMCMHNCVTYMRMWGK